MTLKRVLTEKRRIVVPLLLGIAANAVLFAVVVFPLGRQVASAEVEARGAHDLLNKARLDYQSAKATVTGKHQADAALQKFYTDVLPPTQAAARTLTYTRLSQLARQASVHLEHGSNAVTHEKGSQLSKLTTTYTLTGDYRAIRAFIYSIETAPEFIVLENVGLTSATDQGPGRSLTMTLEIATYFRAGDAGE